MKINHNVSKIKKTIINYISNNIKELILISILFIIGIFVGVIVINNCNEKQSNEISTYISDSINMLKNTENLDRMELIYSSIKNNIKLALIIWIAGTTVIGVPIVLTVIMFRGLCLGYTISAISFTIGKGKGLLFCIVTLFTQNILFIPALLSLGVSSIKLYKSIIKDKRKENIKIEMIRHTVFSLLMLIVLIISSFLENIISITILKKIINFF